MERSYLAELFEQHISSVWKEHSPTELYSVNASTAAKFKKYSYSRDAEYGKAFLEAVMLHGVLAIAARLKHKLGPKFEGSVLSSYAKLFQRIKRQSIVDELKEIAKTTGSIAGKVSDVLIKKQLSEWPEDRLAMFVIGSITRLLSDYLLPAPAAWRLRGALLSRTSDKGIPMKQQLLKLYVSFAAQAAHALGELLALVMYIKKHNVNRQMLEKPVQHYQILKFELLKAYRNATIFLPTLMKIDALQLMPNIRPESSLAKAA